MVRNIWFLLICLTYSPVSLSQTDIFSFAVKGGVSLGSYEAGLNWVYLEEIKRRQHVLNTFTGASAGSINALISAIRFCEQNSQSDVEDNIFRKTWDIGMDDLFGVKSENKSKQYRDFIDNLEHNIQVSAKNIIGRDSGGLFNRSGLLSSLQKIYETIETGSFRDGCEVKVGISVTKFIPDSYSVNGISIKNQRYIIPFIVRVKDQKLRFYNTPLLSDDPRDTDRLNGIDHFIFLREEEEGISVFDIFRSVIASSAFPIAFPPVRLQYCIAGRQIESNASFDCHTAYKAREDLFIDGGSLDNAPIGSARRLSTEFSCSVKKHSDCLIADGEKFNLIYINPGSIRERNYKQMAQDDSRYQDDDAIVGIIDYLWLAGHIMEYGMSAELYRSLTAQGMDKQTRLLSSSRFYPLVGDYIEHFGAFFDSAYRRFDYYVGVYDGIVNVASYFCRNRPDNSKCKSEEIKEILDKLEIKEKDNAAYIMFVLQASKEFYAEREAGHWQWLFDEYQGLSQKMPDYRKAETQQGKIVDIFYALDERDCLAPKSCDSQVKKPAFTKFLGALTVTGRYDKNTQKMVRETKNWNHAILDRMLDRTIAVEEMKLNHLQDSIDKLDEDSEHQEKLKALNKERDMQQVLVNGLEIVSLYGQSFFKKNSRGYWPASTIEDKCYFMFGGWKCLIPDEFGIHTDNVGGYISYRLQFRSAFRGQSIDIGLDPVHFALNTDDYASAEALYRFDYTNVFITSLGFGGRYYRTIGEKDRFVDDQYLGIVTKVGLFSDKLKVTAAWRLFTEDVNFRQRVELTFGINDTRGILDILW